MGSFDHFGTIVGRMTYVKEDGTRTPCTGSVTLVPKVRGDILSAGSEDTVIPAVYFLNLDSEGYITYKGSRNIQVLATDIDGVSPENWTYTVTAKLRYENDRPLKKTWSILVPEGTEVDIFDSIPVPASGGILITKGDKGEPGPPGVGIQGPPGDPGVPDNTVIEEFNQRLDLIDGGKVDTTQVFLKTQSDARYAKIDVEPVVESAIQPTDLESALALKANLVNGKIASSEIPSLALVEPFVVANRAELLALDVQKGDIGIVNSTDSDRGTYILKQEPASNFANWKLAVSPLDTVQSVNGNSGPVVLSYQDVNAAPTNHTHVVGDLANAGNAGKTILTSDTIASIKQYLSLNNLDNTRDIDKIISSLTQTALDAKAGTMKVDYYGTPQTATVWNKPAGAKTITIEVQGGGGGGGSGRRGPAGVARVGGASGGTGGFSRIILPASLIPDTLYLTAGAGGSGGSPVTTDTTSGSNGIAGGFSCVSESPTNMDVQSILLAEGGAGGGGGGTTTSTGGSGGVGDRTGGIGGSSTATGVSNPGFLGAGSGGGSITASDSPTSWGSIGRTYVYATNTGTSMSNYTLSATVNGLDAVLRPAAKSGLPLGGTGSPASITADVGRGGHGINGGAGGGGGASLNGFASGRGGNGGDGFVKIITSF